MAIPFARAPEAASPRSGVTARNCAASYQRRPSRSRFPSMSFRACAVGMHVPSPHTLSRMYQHFSVAFTVRHAMYWPLSPEAIRGRGALSLHGRTSLPLIPTSKVMCGCSSAKNQRSLHLPDFNSELRTWAFNCWTRGEHQQKSFCERSLLVSEKKSSCLAIPASWSVQLESIQLSKIDEIRLIPSSLSWTLRSLVNYLPGEWK